ncbi:MAG TPA: NUDIX domain-containing protein [Deltaproteobacteria bacterium]|jgi:NADH pyrophosphatase NudC (nudix superfamily)|nr:NUDIX domain-containing protein [Deltaproteobacteria bacterium]
MDFCPKCGSRLVAKEIDSRTRKACPADACGYVFWDNPVPIVAAIVEHEGKVILVRNQGWPEKMFGLVSGFLEKGETPDHAALREVKEELDLDGRIEGFIGYYSFIEMNQLILAFHIVAQGEIRMSEELQEFKCVDPAEIRPWPFGTGQAVKDWLETRASSSR